MQGNLSASLVKHGIVHRSLGFDYQGIETLQIKPEDWHSIAVILYVSGYNYLRSQCAYDVAPGGLLASVYHLTRIEYSLDQPEEKEGFGSGLPILNSRVSLNLKVFTWGPRFKKIRRLGALPGLTRKELPVGSEQSRSSKKSQYRIRLEEKQKLRFHYGLTERQLLKYVRIAGKAKGSTGEVLLQLLEMRLDNILFRLGMAATIPQARQLVNHRHVLVNGRIVDIPSYRCKPEDIITAKDDKKSRTLIQNSLESAPRKQLPTHLILPFQYKGLVKQIIDSKWVGLEINELLVVEYYSRQT
ncbi:40S ribosomal protein S4 (chloroplast) [Lathyrus oleraceus]|nr:40S ribosomal protein S4 [Pisum sativum]